MHHPLQRKVPSKANASFYFKKSPRSRLGCVSISCTRLISSSNFQHKSHRIWDKVFTKTCKKYNLKLFLLVKLSGKFVPWGWGITRFCQGRRTSKKTPSVLILWHEVLRIFGKLHVHSLPNLLEALLISLVEIYCFQYLPR